MQRVTIAKDAIAQLRISKYKAQTGSYMESLKTDYENVKRSDDVKSNFDKIKSCRVCALGACLLSAVKFKNTLKFKDLYEAAEDNHFSDNDNIKNLLGSLFSLEQLFLNMLLKQVQHSHSWRLNTMDFIDVTFILI